MSNKSFGYGFAVAQNPSWSVADVIEATKGKLVSGREDVVFRSISTDSRSIEPGDLFLALTGDRFDGHDFIEKAILNGASGIIASKPPNHTPPITLIIVSDTLHALGDLAAFRRTLMPRLRVVGITGSSGKTTVKEMVATILATRMNVLKTQGNFNNLVGMPLSLLPVDYAHDAAVLEMGMNRPGEIARLTEIANPDIGCIVNVQGAHLEGLKDIDGVAAAKGELFDGMNSSATIVVNLDDPQVKKLSKDRHQKKITFGLVPDADVRATNIRNSGEHGMEFSLHLGAETATVRLKSLGQHSVMNGLAATAICAGMGMALNEIVAGLQAFKPYDKRMQVQNTRCGLKVVNDTYNANPASMLAALQSLKGLSRDHKTIVVLGDMLELGKESKAAHDYIGKSVASIGFDYLYAVGDFSQNVVKAAQEAGMAGDRAVWFASKEKLVKTLVDSFHCGSVKKGDWVLVKGSRGMSMETIVEELGNI